MTKEQRRKNWSRWYANRKAKDPDYLKKRRGQNKLNYNKNFKAPIGFCEICRKESKLNRDHCHTTGKLRGLICRDCNLLLGNSKDNLVTLAEAIKYLERYI